MQVRKSGSPVPSTRVDVQGGPSPGYYLTGKTNGSGNITFDVPQTWNPAPCRPGSASCYTVTAWNAAGTGTGQQLNVKVPTNQTITVNVP